MNQIRIPYGNDFSLVIQLMSVKADGTSSAISPMDLTDLQVRLVRAMSKKAITLPWSTDGLTVTATADDVPMGVYDLEVVAKYGEQDIRSCESAILQMSYDNSHAHVPTASSSRCSCDVTMLFYVVGSAEGGGTLGELYADIAQLQEQVRSLTERVEALEQGSPAPDEPEEPTIVPVESITLDKSSADLIEGDTLQLVATVLPDSATDKTVTWASSEPTIATVADGLVVAIAPGSAVITASAGEFVAECLVGVVAKEEPVVPVESITLDKSSADLIEGDTLQLVATVLPDNATDKTVTWISSAPTIATVADGLVTAIAPGTASIVASAGEFMAECLVEVEAKEEPDEPIVPTGEWDMGGATTEGEAIDLGNATTEGEALDFGNANVE